MVEKIEGDNLAGFGARLKRSMLGKPSAAIGGTTSTVAERAEIERRQAMSPLDGRRSKRPPAVDAVQLNMRVPAATKAAFMACAQARGVPMIEALEWAIELMQLELEKGRK